MLAASTLRKALISTHVHRCAELRKPHKSRATLMSASSGTHSVKLVLVGDVHHQWDERDATALKHLQPDVALFVGDFGEEVVDLVHTIKQQVDAHQIPAAYILGNHDAWHSLSKKDLSGYDDARLAGTQAQLQILGQDHVGYRFKLFPDHRLSIVGGRPFSAGGAAWARAAKFNHIMHGLGSMQASADRISATIQQQPAEHAVVVMAHNGPAGLGDQQHDICGKDWSDKAGDHGDPDLQTALNQAAASGRPVALAVFGHMHHTLKGGTKRRNMVHIDAQSGTVMLNCAVVPRWGGCGVDQNTGACESLHHFTVVSIAAAGYVESASHVWVNVTGGHCQTSVHEGLVWTQSYQNGKLVRTCLNTGGAPITTDPSGLSLPYQEPVVSTHKIRKQCTAE